MSRTYAPIVINFEIYMKTFHTIEQQNHKQSNFISYSHTDRHQCDIQRTEANIFLL